jgi:hypothetical protein
MAMKSMVTAAAFFCVLSVAATAAPSAPVGLDAMRKAFVTALGAKNFDAAAKLSSFPLAIVVYQMPPKITAAQFAKAIPNLGLDDAGVQHCIANDPLTLVDSKSASDKRFANSWNADCNGNEYHFARAASGAWLFLGYENINE